MKLYFYSWGKGNNTVLCSGVYYSTLQIPVCDSKETTWFWTKGSISREISHEQKSLSVQMNNTTPAGIKQPALELTLFCTMLCSKEFKKNFKWWGKHIKFNLFAYCSWRLRSNLIMVHTMWKRKGFEYLGRKAHTKKEKSSVA